MSLCRSGLTCPSNLHQSITKSIRVLASVRTYYTTPALCHVQAQECLAPDRVSTHYKRAEAQSKKELCPSPPFSSTDGKIQSNPNPIVCSDQKPLSWNKVHKLSLRTNDMRKRECVLTG